MLTPRRTGKRRAEPAEARRAFGPKGSAVPVPQAAQDLAIVENRLALVAVEFSEEKLRLVEVLFWVSLFLLLGLMSVLLLTLTVVLLCGEGARLLVLAAFSLVYLSGTVGAFLILRQRLKNWPAPFAETIAEIRKDRECLRAPKS